MPGHYYAVMDRVGMIEFLMKELEWLLEKKHEAMKASTDWAGDAKTMLFYQGKEKAFGEMILRLKCQLGKSDDVE